MISTEEIRSKVIELKQGAASTDQLVENVAKSLRTEGWEKLLDQVRLVVEVLERESSSK